MTRPTTARFGWRQKAGTPEREAEPEPTEHEAMFTVYTCVRRFQSPPAPHHRPQSDLSQIAQVCSADTAGNPTVLLWLCVKGKYNEKKALAGRSRKVKGAVRVCGVAITSIDWVDGCCALMFWMLCGYWLVFEVWVKFIYWIFKENYSSFMFGKNISICVNFLNSKLCSAQKLNFK